MNYHGLWAVMSQPFINIFSLQEGDGAEDDEEPGSRKKIRKIKSDKKLKDTTKAAAKAEEERRKRISEKQKHVRQYSIHVSFHFFI
jgi:hypothetical protein